MSVVNTLDKKMKCSVVSFALVRRIIGMRVKKGKETSD